MSQSISCATGLLLLGAVSLFGAMACSPHRAPPPRVAPEQATVGPSQDAAQTVRGRLTLSDLEGGFWGIITDSGERLRVVGAAGTDWRDGARVVARVKRLPVGPSLQMWGEPVEILSLQQDEGLPTPRRE